MSYKSYKGDVSWHLPNEKKAFAYSTIATSDLITTLSEEYSTVQDVYSVINYDNEAKEILKYFIKNGYGNYLLRDFVHINQGQKYRKKENGEIITIDLKDLKKNLDKNNDDYDYGY